MEDHIIVPIMEIDSNWMMHGFSSEQYAAKYCKHLLHIPVENIKKTLLNHQGLEIILCNKEEIEKEAWYIRLKRLSK
ncbi:hypothetical protein [Sulfurovum sp.]|uniref:hypothetical protein n=2 Tax=Sulfurovum sp. TaxID=1969726 RepID=UPI0025E044E1|nr:hypothetical protein [Sulfurovum sp.]